MDIKAAQQINGAVSARSGRNRNQKIEQVAVVDGAARCNVHWSGFGVGVHVGAQGCLVVRDGVGCCRARTVSVRLRLVSREKSARELKGRIWLQI